MIAIALPTLQLQLLCRPSFYLDPVDFLAILEINVLEHFELPHEIFLLNILHKTRTVSHCIK